MTAPLPFDVERVRGDFPVLGESVRGKPLVYLDNAATAQVPSQVIEAISEFHAGYRSNIHRGVHTLSQRSTSAYEDARKSLQRFIGAAHPEEVVFVRGTTEAMNLVAHGVGARLQAGDEVIVTAMEHHSNIVPWQIVCATRGATLRVAPINDAGELDLEAFKGLVNERTRFVSAVWISNALGTVNPIRQMIAHCHAAGIEIAVDAAQAAPHSKIDVVELGCDYLALSGHKLFGPTGIGVLYGRKEIFEELPPYQGGGDMIEHVSFDGSTWAALPSRFEAGTPNIAGAIGLAAAVDYLEGLDREGAEAHELELLRYATELIGDVPGGRVVGTAAEKAGVLSFVMEGAHPHDIGTILDQQGIAIRTGHHCAEPVMKRLGVGGTARASFAFYNTKSEVEAFIRGLHTVADLFGLAPSRAG